MGARRPGRSGAANAGGARLPEPAGRAQRVGTHRGAGAADRHGRVELRRCVRQLHGRRGGWRPRRRLRTRRCRARSARRQPDHPPAAAALVLDRRARDRRAQAARGGARRPARRLRGRRRAALRYRRDASVGGRSSRVPRRHLRVGGRVARVGVPAVALGAAPAAAPPRRRLRRRRRRRRATDTRRARRATQRRRRRRRAQRLGGRRRGHVAPRARDAPRRAHDRGRAAALQQLRHRRARDPPAGDAARAHTLEAAARLQLEHGAHPAHCARPPSAERVPPAADGLGQRIDGSRHPRLRHDQRDAHARGRRRAQHVGLRPPSRPLCSRVAFLAAGARHVQWRSRGPRLQPPHP